MPEYELLPVTENRQRANDGIEAVDYLDAQSNSVDLVLLDMRFDVSAERLLPLPEASSLRRQRRYQGGHSQRVEDTLSPTARRCADIAC